MSDGRQDSVMDEARQWFVLLQDVAATAADRQAHQAWLDRDPAHRAAWARVVLLWSRMDETVSALRATAMPPRPASRQAWTRRAAAVAVILGAGYAVARSGFAADYETGTGEQRTILLSDGSTAELGGDSALTLAFDSGIRRVRLLRGEAFFQVAPDAERPFVVAAEAGETRALGTEFRVGLRADTVVVSVIRHAVSVRWAGQEAVTLDEGQEVRYGAAGLGPVHAADGAAARRALREGRLFFEEAPLGEVLADLGRYRRGRIVILDDGIAEIPVSGAFRTDAVDAALETIAATLGLRITRLTGLLVLVRKGDGPRPISRRSD